jgi:hypothetical protein
MQTARLYSLLPTRTIT